MIYKQLFAFVIEMYKLLYFNLMEIFHVRDQYLKAIYQIVLGINPSSEDFNMITLKL